MKTTGCRWESGKTAILRPSSTETEEGDAVQTCFALEAAIRLLRKRCNQKRAQDRDGGKLEGIVVADISVNSPDLEVQSVNWSRSARLVGFLK